MENQIQVFSSPQFGEIRTIEVDGTPYFVGNDVAAALGYEKPRNAIARYVDAEDALKRGGVSKTTNQYGVTTEQNVEMTYINESGVYALVFGSKLPTAKAFKRWVTSEVLPSIRKSGSYVSPRRAPATQSPSVSDRIRAAKFLASFLNLNESSKLLLAKSIADPLGLPTPDYTPSRGVLRSCAELLKEHTAPLSPQQFNQRMIQRGYMVELTRPSSKGSVKKFKSIIGDGLQYGENQVNPNNPKSTQPLYYADKFGELMGILSAN